MADRPLWRREDELAPRRDHVQPRLVALTLADRACDGRREFGVRLGRLEYTPGSGTCRIHPTFFT